MTDATETISLHDLVLLPHRSELYRLVGEQLEALCSIEYFLYTKRVLGGNRWIVAIKGNYNSLPDLLNRNKPEKYQIYRAKINNDGTVSALPDIELDSHFLNQSLAIKGDVIYMGGNQVVHLYDGKTKSTGEVAGFLNLTLDKPEWQPLPLPGDVQVNTTESELLACEDKLIQVDSLYNTKYLLEYDITVPMAPVLSVAKSLSQKKILDSRFPLSTTNINLTKLIGQRSSGGSMNKNWIAFKNNESWDSGSRQQISLFSLQDLSNFFTVSLWVKSSHKRFDYARMPEEEQFTTLEDELEKARNHVVAYDYTITGDLLVIACGFHGLAVFNLAEMLDEYLSSEQEKLKAESDLSQGVSPRWYNINELPWDGRIRKQIEGIADVRHVGVLNDGRVLVSGYGEIMNEHVLKVISI